MAMHLLLLSSMTATALARRHLFFDMSAIESNNGTAIRMHPAVIDDSAPRLSSGGLGGGPWEGGRIIGYNSVVDNGTHVLMYYDAFSVNGQVKHDIQRCTCLAISSDGGKTFTKPRLGLVAFNGSFDNNIVMPRNKTSWSSGTVFMDENPEAPPSERYKLIALWNPATHLREDDSGTWTFASPDGIHFTPLSTAAVYHGSDTQDVALFDSDLKKYVAFRRLHQPQPRPCVTCAGRAVRARPPGPHWENFGCAYAHGNACPPPSSPLRCNTTDDCDPLHYPDPTCESVRISCLPSKQCGAAGKGPGGLACMEWATTPPSTPPGWCGAGAAAERFVGRCEADSLAAIPGCDEGHPPNETEYTTVFGPDGGDSPCVDIYTNQVVRYEGHYLAFPGAYEHFPEPPNWPVGNDGWYDTRILHSADGATNWSYIAGDRNAFMGRGKSDAPPLPASSGCLNCTDSRTWRESMVAAVRGYTYSQRVGRTCIPCSVFGGEL